MNDKTFYKVGENYSVTINPIDKHQYAHVRDRLSKFRNYVNEQIIPYMTGDYDFVIEYSEPRGMHTQGYLGSRLHMHGIMRFRTTKQVGDFLNTSMYRIYRTASMDIDTVEDVETWRKYMFKQRILNIEYKYISSDIKTLRQVDGIVKQLCV